MSDSEEIDLHPLLIHAEYVAKSLDGYDLLF